MAFFPSKVPFALSNDGMKWQHLKEGASRLPTTEPGPIRQKIGIDGIHAVAIRFHTRAWIRATSEMSTGMASART
ncbi:hypothetical protein J6TS7_62980 [Paenibacillus dendritiformis]|nr:hypothetical protein J6TS7_62980 [Paenibacillus dendritiformis]